MGRGQGRVGGRVLVPDSHQQIVRLTEEPVLTACTRARGGRGAPDGPQQGLSRSGETRGGLVQDIQWDPGHRLAITKETSAVDEEQAGPGEAHSLLGLRVTEEAEFPVTTRFRRKAPEYGALLTVVWSSRRVQHLPPGVQSARGHPGRDPDNRGGASRIILKSAIIPNTAT